MKKIEQIIFPQNVQVGKVYLVPCVYLQPGKCYATPASGVFVPINSHLHNDKKLIGVDFDHWHIDWRFASAQMWKGQLLRWNGKGQKQNDSIGKIEVANVVIFGKHPDKFMDWSNNTTKNKVVYKRLLCKRAYSAGEFFSKDFPNAKKKTFVFTLPKHFCGSKLKRVGNTLICPHRGVHIDKNCKDDAGNYVCPGHLLRFDPETLMVIQND